jgi:fermentation-respiration switch protein FrsA (DUF1100 family)
LFVVAASPAAAEGPSFDYDRSRPLGVAPADVVLRNLTYVDASGDRAEATLVAPARHGRYPGILFVHWYGEPSQSSTRSQFLSDALQLGGKNVVSLLVDTPWSDPGWFTSRDPARDFSASVEEVKDLRRALDVLGSLEDVDPERLAFVGHDFGAMYGAVMAGVDRRPKAFVFMAGTDAFSDWFLLSQELDEPGRRKVQEELAPLDPVRHVGQIAPTSVLFQFAAKDRYVTREAADALVAAAREPKSAKFYDCGHALNDEATQDRIAWLLRTLGVEASSR